MEKHPDFQREPETPSLERTRELANKRHHLLWEQKFFGIEEVRNTDLTNLFLTTKFFVLNMLVLFKATFNVGLQSGNLQL